MGEAREVLLGVDIGTTSAKALAFAADGGVHASAGRGYGMATPRPGVAEQDADEVTAAVVAAIREAARDAREAGHHVTGLSFSAAMHGLLGVDAAGRPLTPVLTWADHRASPQAARLRSEDGLALHRRTGTPVHPMSPLVKLRWFAEEDAATAADVRHWYGIKEHVLRALTGELVIDHGLASGSGLFNLADLDWDAQALDYAGVERERLPRPVPTTQRLVLTDDGAATLGLPQATPIVAGSGDGPLANLGLGAVRPGTAACSIGTSGALRVAAEDPRIDEHGRVFCYILAPGRYVVGGAINNGGVVLDWLADAIAPDVEGMEALLEAAARVPAGSGGLLFLPYLLGERAPHWSGDPRGAYIGLVRDHRREHLLRSGIEGVCLQLAVVLAALGAAGIEVREIRATGGFARSALWRGILASSFGRPIGFAASPEGSALGAALLGMTELGMLDSLDRAAEIVRITDRQPPDRGDAEVYARLLPIFDAGFGALASTFEALAALAGQLPLDPPTEEDP